MKKHFGPQPELRGQLRPPGDKSISHRGLILAAMATGSSTISNCASGDDVRSTRSSLERLGIEVTQEKDAARIAGVGERFGDGESRVELDAGNSATTMRLLMGALAPSSREFTFFGDASLTPRPMDRVAEPLRLMGADVDLEDDRHAPVRLRGGPLKGISYVSPVATAQVKGAILLAAIRANGSSDVREPHRSRDHTERLLSWLGVHVTVEGTTVYLEPPDRPAEGFHLYVPGDISSAAYLIVAACLAEKADVSIENVGLNPTRLGMVEVLQQMGARIEVDIAREEPEPSGTIRVRSSELHGIRIGGEVVPRCIDELPLIAVAATQAKGTTEVVDASELRHKEADRISALVSGLRSVGARIDELPDGFVIEGSTRLEGGLADSRGDHRLALAFAIAGLTSTGGVDVAGWEATAISYPTFEQDLARISQ